MKIYTKTGDKGKTSLFGGQRVSKTDLRVETYGTVDELNSYIGLASTFVRQQKLKVVLTEIKSDLLDIGSHLATPGAKEPTFLLERITAIELLIDTLTATLPELRNFILSGGGKAGGFLHVARTVCRRTERMVIRLSQKEEVSSIVLQYFNRLSDLLFTLARYVNHKEKKKEIIWQSKAKIG